MATRTRKAGSSWRILAWANNDADKVEMRSGDHPGAIFDEVVVDRWLHVEQMSNRTWWASVGGVVLWVDVDREGRATAVSVHLGEVPTGVRLVLD
jgi:hypothetical protein